MGLGAYPGNDRLSLDMLGMHGSVYANYAVDEADLLLAIGVRFDDRVTGKVAEFAQHGFIVHIDIDPSEINKNKLVHVPVVADVEDALHALNKIVEKPDAPLDDWYARIAEWKQEDPFSYDRSYPGILAQEAIDELSRLTADRDTIVAVGVGQHQMWAAQFFKFREPRTWLSSSGLGTMGFGLPAAMGAKVARPDAIVVDIDGDGSILMNIQEFATCKTENIPVKVLLLNNQHLGMVVQWEDRFFKGNRAHTYLGPVDHPEAAGQGDGISPGARYPDFVSIAKGFGWQAETISEKSDLVPALQRLIAAEGPALLDVQVPYQEQVLPMIPSGMTVRELIKR
jgi:acetolactate synthase I/II/III large subunit